MKQQCEGTVYRPNNPMLHRTVPCTNPAKVQRGEKWYCGVHDPQKREERNQAFYARLDAEQKERERETRRKELLEELMQAAQAAVADAELFENDYEEEVMGVPPHLFAKLQDTLDRLEIL